MSELIAVGTRRRRSRAEAERLLRKFEQNGLKRLAFCAECGLSVAALDRDRRRRGSLERRPTQLQSAIRIVPLESVNGMGTAAASRVESCRGLHVELANGRRIEGIR
jgi:hypothetical protein